MQSPSRMPEAAYSSLRGLSAAPELWRLHSLIPPFDLLLFGLSWSLCTSCTGRNSLTLVDKWQSLGAPFSAIPEQMCSQQLEGCWPFVPTWSSPQLNVVPSSHMFGPSYLGCRSLKTRHRIILRRWTPNSAAVSSTWHINEFKKLGFHIRPGTMQWLAWKFVLSWQLA